MTAEEERAYVEGSRAAWLSMLRECLKQLGHDDTDAARVRWIAEREQTVAVLRTVCRTHGDNEWEDGCHLADVVDKHLYRHLESPE
jgi:hypothetical protein